MSYLAYKSRRKVVVDELAEGQELSIAQKHKIVGEIADDPNIKVCLQSELIVKFWGALESVDGRRFYNTRFFSSKWVINTIHSPGGGVSYFSLDFKKGQDTYYGCSSFSRSSV